jgi:C4-dicarboxylate-specific signal transduction histidine kinase
MVRRKRAQVDDALRTAHGELEKRVEARTAELEQAKSELQMEIAQR